MKILRIGNRIKRQREFKGLTQKEASRGITSVSHFSNIENGRFQPSADILRLLAKRLEVPVEYFLDIHIEDIDTEKTLDEYEYIINSKDVKKIEEFESKRSDDLIYIPSIVQEFRFNLLKYLSFLEQDRFNEAICHYKKEISGVCRL
ncbi:helix-turn-helix transcriptional regulator, partial [Sporosarcina saromensis]